MTVSTNSTVLSPKIGIQLPTLSPLKTAAKDIKAAASLAEELGFDSVWVGDHLTFNSPVVEAFIAAATAAAATTNVRIGFGVLIAALRTPAWLAKQISSLQVVSGERVDLGIGIGGEFEGEWVAACVPKTERGRRTDAILNALPSLLSGTPTTLGEPWNCHVPPLLPCAGMPPLWVGGRSDHALQRAARAGGGWMGLWMTLDRITQCRSRLEELKPEGDAPVPIGLEILVHPSSDSGMAKSEMESYMGQIYNVPYERLQPFTLHGENGIVEGLEQLWEAGVTNFVLLPATDNFQSVAPELAAITDKIRGLTAKQTASVN